MNDVKRKDLFPLDRIETIGKQYQTLTGQILEYEKFLYLTKHERSQPSMLQLLSQSALEEQGHLRTQFYEQYYKHGSLGTDFIPDGLPLAVERLPRYVSIPEHAHAFIELACVIRGECRHVIEGREYRQGAGTLAFVGVGAHHEVTAIEDALCFTVKVHREFFLELKLPFMLDFITPVQYSCGSDPFYSQLVLALWEQQRERPFQVKLLALLFETLMLYIGQNYRDTMQRLYYSPLLDQKMIPVLDYMAENYTAVTLNSLARHFHYSVPYLSKLIHEKTGQTFSQQIRNLRLDQAARLLRETNKKLDAICEEVGYTDVTQFIHNFKKKYGTTPIRYRKLNSVNP